MKFRVLITDDHALLRQGIKQIINSDADLEVVAEANNGQDAIKAARQFSPDVIVMDLSMPVMNGVQATRYLTQELPDINILMLTVSDKDSDLFDALKAGAKGYMLKDCSPDELTQAVKYVAEGGIIISAGVAQKLHVEMRSDKNPSVMEKHCLSDRESEILELVAQGLADKEIASTLLISINTVKTHLKNIFSKLHLKSRTQAATYIFKETLVKS